MTDNQPEITIVGGGVVGLSIAVGLLQSGHKVIVLDGKDNDARASFGNFGLVWGQGKGWDFAPYAKLTADAIDAWQNFSDNLNELSGLDVSLDQKGGFEFFTDPEEFKSFIGMLEIQKGHSGNRFSYETISGDELRKQIPGIGSKVVGATFSQLDGHVNPLRFLRALQRSVQALGGKIRSNTIVKKTESNKNGGFSLTLANGTLISTEKVILCAGLGSMKLANQLAFKTNIRPEKGELLITEKLGSELPFLSSTIRQVDEGGVQIGGTNADVGMNDSETLSDMVDLARHAVDVYPALSNVRVLRAWGALRVMTPDGYPVYAQSEECPGAYLITCHSGVTLASLHASILSDWIDDNIKTPNLEAFDEARFKI